MKRWSVETANNSWNDDEFVGSFRACMQYCRSSGYKIDGVEARLAHIEDRKGVCEFVYEYYYEDGGEIYIECAGVVV